MNYVGRGRGEYTQEAGYRYVGFGGDFGRPRRDFTCLLCLLSLLLLIPLLCWLLWPRGGYDCQTGFETCLRTWPIQQQSFCCRQGRCCVHPQPVVLPAPVAVPAGPVDPYNCADGFLNWRAEWSIEKMQWCCNIHGKGCPNPGEGFAEVQASQYDCDAGFANWVKGWSVNKKTWCCQHAHKGCVGSGALDAGAASAQGYGAGAQHGVVGAPTAAITGIQTHAQLAR